eukprot:5744516-Amphidinium_carterae.1
MPTDCQLIALSFYAAQWPSRTLGQLVALRFFIYCFLCHSDSASNNSCLNTQLIGECVLMVQPVRNSIAQDSVSTHMVVLTKSLSLERLWVQKEHVLIESACPKPLYVVWWGLEQTYTTKTGTFLQER